MSILEFDKTIPVRPPIENRKMNPNDHRNGIFIVMNEVLMVVIQLKILIPVGIAIIIVAAVKYARVSMSRPTVNI